jgi:hypothetical protein
LENLGGVRAFRVVIVLVVGSLSLAVAPLSARGSQVNELPNLVPLPAFDIAIGPSNSSPDASVALRFAAATANKGDFALDLFGQPDEIGVTSAAASQCVDWGIDRVCASRRTVGRFLWHPDHGHYHFEDFALYELRRFRPNGKVNFKPRGLVATSGKVSFCVIDVEQDRSPSSPLYLFPYPLYYSCFAGVGFQGISPGWRDVYSAFTQGQEFPREELIPGRLALVIYADPVDRLHETRNDDNLAVTGIEISPDLSKVEVFCTSEPGSGDCSLPQPPQ